MAGLTTSRAKVLFVVTSAIAASFVLPISAEGLVVLTEQQLAMDPFHDGLVQAIPCGRGVTFNDPVCSMPQAYSTDG